MSRSTVLPALLASVALTGCGEPPAATGTKSAPPRTAEAAPAQTPPDLPAGDYKLDPSHASLLFRVDHLGISKYTGRFTRYDAKLHLDPARPEVARLEATIDPRSLSVESPPAGFEDTLRGGEWLNAAAHPQITYRSTKVTPTGPRAARIDGDLSFRGVTRPVSLNATFNGGYRGHPMDPNARIGFSATGVLKRSEFGMSYGIPAPGTTMGVGDAVELIIEAEFTGPPLAKAA
jgi:polyisoprenoid-binding protein YceI